MSAETLYWILSTIPQVSAALVAFIGFLVLSILDEPSRRRQEFENLTRQEIREKTEFTLPSYQRFKEVGEQIHVIPGDKLMEMVGPLLSQPPRLTHLERYQDGWQRLNRWIKRTRGLLLVFIFCQLVIIAASLGLIPFIPSVVSIPYLSVVIIFAIVIMVFTSGVM